MNIFCDVCKKFYNDENGVCNHCQKNEKVIKNKRYIIGNPPKDICQYVKTNVEERVVDNLEGRKRYKIKQYKKTNTPFPPYTGPKTIGCHDDSKPKLPTYVIGDGKKRFPETYSSEKNVWLVYQGKTFECESKGGYVWAPLYNKQGRCFNHWENVGRLKKGDIILHSVYRHIFAVSVVESEKPEECSHPDNAWGDGYDVGRMVRCKYYLLKQPVPSKELLNVILENYHYNNSPFNQKGEGNQGYMYSLNKKIFKAYAEKIQQKNSNVNFMNNI